MSRTINRDYQLEKLLESLIKMVGRSNEKVDHLEKRVYQLELILRESFFETRNKISFIADPSHSHNRKQTS
ncbi:hypothetical protein SM124_08830 [Bacillus sp. 31A1R]|uniref:Uncharacterized protein n=1 Tax=Robertmurraya mangrovi TaxID=3098077 RepID=A0ABU5IXJ7_9BACI|nr:hypothetical protein [Bacillus sp. 31A1R]MDZ5471852.1 hypothetical protein [Bacillus sp. 31A1R]